MRSNRFVVKSLELHLFFARIMKEHSLFLMAGFTPAAPSFSSKAEFFMKEFEALLCEAVQLSNGIVGEKVLCSGEVVTDFTALAEKQTECFTGIPINKDITSQTLCLKGQNQPCGNPSELQRKVRRMNLTALKLLQDPALVEAAWKEHKDNGVVYECLMPADLKPKLDRK